LLSNNERFSKENIAPPTRTPDTHGAARLPDLNEIIGEFLFFDDKKAISIRLNQPKIPKSLHEQTDPGPRDSHHLGQPFVRNLQLNPYAARVFLAHC
jgi:hypothetical protein